MRRLLCRLPLVLLPVALGACSALSIPDGPDSAYSPDAQAAVQLQVPPDLTGIDDAEQFVLPGTTGGPVTRNTLLPEFDSVRFVRDAGEAHLAFEQSAEDLWPRLLEFLARDGWSVDRTEPVAGILTTRWREATGAERPGALRSLIGGGDDLRSRVAFRLERAGDGARLYARRQIAEADAVEAGSAAEWPATSSDPEATSGLLARLLAHLGVDEQRRRGLIDAAAADEVLEIATVRTGTAGSRLVVHRGYRSAWEATLAALEAGDMRVQSTDDSVGRIVFVDPSADVQPADVQPLDAASAPALADGSPVGGEADGDVSAGALVLDLVPVHVSAVRVGVTDAAGRRLDAARERELLDALRASLLRGQTV